MHSSESAPPVVLGALASERRCEIVWQLSERPHTVRELRALTGLSQPALSKQLRVLRDARLVDCEPLRHDRRVRVYRLREDALLGVADWFRMLLAACSGVPYEPLDSPLEERTDPRDSPYTTRGTPRIRRRLYWRKEDAEAAERGDAAWVEREMARLERGLRRSVGHRYWTYGRR